MTTILTTIGLVLAVLLLFLELSRHKKNHQLEKSRAEAQYRRAEDVVVLLNKRAEECRTLEAESVRRRDELESLKEKYQADATAHAEMYDEYYELTKKHDRDTERLDTALESLSRAHRDLAALSDKYEKLKQEKPSPEEYGNLLVRIQEAEHALAMATAGSAATQADKVAALREVDKCKQDSDDKINNLTERNDHLSKKIAQLETENKNLILDRNNYLLQHSKVEEQLRNAKIDLTTLDTKHTKLTAEKTKIERQLDQLNKQLTASTETVLDGRKKGVGFVDHPNGNRVYYIVVNRDELNHDSYLSWPDDKLGAMLRGRMVTVDNTNEEEGELNFTASALLMTSRMLDLGATDFDIDLGNVQHENGEDIGKVRIKLYMGDDENPDYDEALSQLSDLLPFEASHDQPQDVMTGAAEYIEELLELLSENHQLSLRVGDASEPAFTFDRALAEAPLAPGGVPVAFDIDGVPMIPRDQHDALIERIVTAKEKEESKSPADRLREDRRIIDARDRLIAATPGIDVMGQETLETAVTNIIEHNNMLSAQFDNQQALAGEALKTISESAIRHAAGYISTLKQQIKDQNDKLTSLDDRYNTSAM